jgi:hypothetical protein
MAPEFKLKFQMPSMAADIDPDAYVDRISGRILAMLAAAAVLVALVLAAESRLPPEQRMGFFEVTTYVSP